MKIANFLLSGLLVASMGFMATGCNENPTEPGDNNNPGAPLAPKNVQVTSLGAASVGLKWEAPADTGTITYRVKWVPETGSDSGSVDVATTSTSISSGLAINKAYTFSVYSVRSNVMSSAISIKWAGAQRYGQTESIRIYETASDNGSGLTLDPPNGPRNVKVGASNTVPNSVQLAIYTKASDPNNFEIGPAYAFTEYQNADKFDQRVYVSTLSYPAQDLNSWYAVEDISQHIPTDGNIRAFTFPVAETGTTGQGFYVRTGDVGTYHYARVFVKKSGGKLLQGTTPNRYIELEISYQQSPGLPYAKPAGYRPTEGNISSKVLYPPNK